ncbi:hypothetical protein WN944_017239 [Citrus x changshan-huyou]|uniref:Uncharacterized protein n=1 Tax=Citrus x changshan-huyou TaxID=2935761 RepID=A0AAP0MFV0_9ROSI
MVLGSVCQPLLTHSPPVSPPPPIPLPFSTCHHSLNQSKEQTIPNQTKNSSPFSLSLSLSLSQFSLSLHSISLITVYRSIYLKAEQFTFLIFSF